MTEASSELKRQTPKTNMMILCVILTTFSYRPIPGDLISGVINTGSGVTIHNRDCKNLLSMSILPQRIIDVCWKDDVESKDSVYPVTLKAIITNKLGSLAEISSILARKNVNINNINIISANI